MSEGTPKWLKAVLRAERMVGSRVESAVHSGAYFEVITVAKRSTSRIAATSEGVSRRILHLVNLPAGTDIRRIREQLVRTERRVVELAKDIEDLAAERSAR